MARCQTLRIIVLLSIKLWVCTTCSLVSLPAQWLYERLRSTAFGIWSNASLGNSSKRGLSCTLQSWAVPWKSPSRRGDYEEEEKFGKWEEKGGLLKWRAVSMNQRTPKTNNYSDSQPLWLSGYHGNTLMPLMVTNMHTEEAVNSTYLLVCSGPIKSIFTPFHIHVYGQTVYILPISLASFLF